MSDVNERAAKSQRLIERPRLIKMLDASNARAMLLIAPAGYGKTTLARQWFGRGDKTVAWYRATDASADVAALAAGLARVADPFVTGAADRMIQLIRNTPAPARDVDEIADAFVEELAPFPPGGWLVIDDYHCVVGSTAAERLIEVLAERGAPRLLIATRRRPRWATARRSVYGEVEEAAQSDLAFTGEEAAQLLPDVPAAELDDFVERAKGWPAVLKLASVSGGRKLPELEVPPALHQYFAEELFQAASPDLQDALVRLALLPTLHPPLLDLVLATDHRPLCREAVALGFLSIDDDSGYEFHPLLRTFLAPRARQMPEAAALGQQVVQALMADGSWDEAFSVVRSLQRPDLLPSLFEAALDELLLRSRVATLEEWVRYANALGAAFPLLDLAEAEIARRFGDLDVGEMRALQAAHTLDSASAFRSRAWAVAGECAHLTGRPNDALHYHQEAERLAATDADVRRAVWGQHVVAVSSEIADAGEALARWNRLADGTPTVTLRSATGALNLGILQGGLERAVAESMRHIHLLDRANPMINTGFLVRLAWACIMSGQYSLGLQYANEGIAEAKRSAVTFALVHFAPPRIAASIGLRRFRHAEIVLDDLTDCLRSKSDSYEEPNAQIIRGRLLLAMGKCDSAALELDPELFEHAPTPALRLEAASLRALALAVNGDAGEALEDAEEAKRSSSEAQGVVMTALAHAVQAAVTADPLAEARLTSAIGLVKTSENYDSFVCAYRVYPPLLSRVAEEQLLSHRKLASVLQGAADINLAKDAGIVLEPPQSRHHSLLTKREREVYELLCQGLSNREIADALVITESTAKVHVGKILRKLDVSSRAQAMRAAHEAL